MTVVSTQSRDWQSLIAHTIFKNHQTESESENQNANTDLFDYDTSHSLDSRILYFES